MFFTAKKKTRQLQQNYLILDLFACFEMHQTRFYQKHEHISCELNVINRIMEHFVICLYIFYLWNLIISKGSSKAQTKCFGNLNSSCPKFLLTTFWSGMFVNFGDLFYWSWTSSSRNKKSRTGRFQKQEKSAPTGAETRSY